MPLVLMFGLASSCAQGTLADVEPVVADVPEVDSAAVDAEAVTPDAPAPEAAVIDVASVDVAPDIAPDITPDVASSIDAGLVDAPRSADMVEVIDRPAEPVDVPAIPDGGHDVPRPDGSCCEGPTGYRVVRDDPAATWVDACALPGHQTVLSDVDDGSVGAILPFRFRYWGVAVAEGAAVLVSPNGYLTFQLGAPTPANGIVPNRLDGVHAVIAAQWRDLRTRAPGVCIATVGNPGARRWVVQWSDARYYTSIFGHLNFEVVLGEAAHTIDLVYAGMTLSEPATVALENWDGSRSSVPFNIPQPIVFSNTRARFIPD